jgi:NADH-quinone oxidoreductase subunit K
MEGYKEMTSPIPPDYALILAAILFALGVAGLLVRRNIIFALISIEIMLNAAGMAFIAAGSRWTQPDGQAFFIFALATAGAEVAVGLALVLQLYKQFRTLDVDAASNMKG